LDIIGIIRARRSVRKFKSDAVPEELIERILDAGRWAPSGLNNQPWRFAIVRDRELIKEISKLTHYRRIVLGAQVLIPVFIDTERIYHREKDIQGIGACLQNMLLEIHSLGLGAVWLGEIIRSNLPIKRILGLGDALELMAVLALGYPDETPQPTRRKALQDLIVYRD
jgi:nitroreductase